MKTLISQIKSKEELDSFRHLLLNGVSVNDVTVSEEYDWSYEVTIDKTSKRRKLTAHISLISQV